VQGSARDITERKRAQEALLTYSRRLLEAQEAERGRIARELHDQIGQMLTALKLNLHAIQSARDAGEASLLIEDNLKMLDEALEQVRDLSVDLRPLLLDDLGLVTALRWFVDRQAKRRNVRAEFTTDSLDPDLRFAAELETACFRIAQEALTNVARHARAKTVTVRLSRNRDYLILLVEDDGVGFDIDAGQGHAPANATLGLRGMQERAHAVGGRVKIDSATNKGTQVFVELPIAMPNGRRPRVQKE
jgi:signal transduction histidine kinase